MRSKSSFANSITVATFLLMLLSTPLFVFAQVRRGPIMGGGIMSPPVNQRPPGLEFVGIEQHLNAEVPVDLEFRDELGNPVKLADYFGHGRPVILNLGYYQCPMLCSELLQGLVGSMKALTFNLGKDFDVLTVSFDPRETTEMAAEKKRDMMKRYGRVNACASSKPHAARMHLESVDCHEPTSCRSPKVDRHDQRAMFGLERNRQLSRGLEVHHKDQPAWSDAGSRTTGRRRRNSDLEAKLRYPCASRPVAPRKSPRTILAERPLAPHPYRTPE